MILVPDPILVLSVLTPGPPARPPSHNKQLNPASPSLRCPSPGSSHPLSSPDPPGGLGGNHMFRMLDCCCCEPEGLFGKGYSVKAVFIYTRAGVFLLCIIICFLMHRLSKPFFLPPHEVKKPRRGRGVGGGWGPGDNGLPSLTLGAPSTAGRLIDGCSLALTEN